MWWHILNVDQELDERSVKKAYAKIIKGIDQDNEIDEFTKIHQAYRMAMKSFKKKAKENPAALSLEEEAGWYLRGLEKIYNDPIKRLDPVAWKNIFACMSFREEKTFIDEYVGFFNDHYCLTIEIWTIVERIYPLGNQKDFKWKDLCNGNLRISRSELIKLPYDKGVLFVESKIKCYYAILQKNYDQAMELLKVLMDLGDHSDICRWSMVVSGELALVEDLKNAHSKLSNHKDLVEEADYILNGYLKRINELEEGQLRASDIWEKVLLVPKKKKILLEKGDYKKAFNSEGVSRSRLFPWGGKKNNDR